MLTSSAAQKNRKKTSDFLCSKVYEIYLLVGKEFGYNCIHFFFAIGVAFYRIDELTTLVLSDNTMSLELGFFNFFLALAGSDENVFKGDLFSLCLFEVIHDDRNFRAKRSSIEIIIS